MTGIRLNTSHESLAEARDVLGLAGVAAARAGTEWELLIDLIGPELRIGEVEEGMELVPDEYVSLCVDEDECVSAPDGSQGISATECEMAEPEKCIPVPECVIEHLEPGDTVLIDDGKLKLSVLDCTNDCTDDCTNDCTDDCTDDCTNGCTDDCTNDCIGDCTGSENKTVKVQVITGGPLLSHKSIAIKDREIPLPALTDADLENIRVAGEENRKSDGAFRLAAVMQPFVRSRGDILEVRAALDANGLSSTMIMAKIESREGIEHLPEFIDACDYVVIARGDLGTATGLTRLPVAVAEIERICKNAGKPFMVVTQLLDSMIRNPFPTRAEVSDIAHAVFDGADSLMLTGETAAGRYPAEAMNCLIETARTAKDYLTDTD